MRSADIRPDEAASLQALHALQILDSAPEAEFDALVLAASLACGVPVALISLVDADRQWFKANIGLPGVAQTPRDVSFCAHAVLHDEPFVVPDATLHPGFADNPLVVGGPGIRFYAGAPILVDGGHRIGTLCVIDRQPRALDAAQLAILQCLAVAAASALQGRRASHDLQVAAQANEQRLRQLYEATPAMLHSIDLQGRLLAVSDMWLSKLGYARADVIGTPVTDYLSPASRVYAHDIGLPAFFATGRADGVAYQFQARDGSLIDILLSARLERDAIGRALRSVAVAEDVTLRRRAEHALVQERQRLANIIDGTDVGTWEWNLATSTLHVNQRFGDMVGRAVAGTHANSAVGNFEAWSACIHPEDRQRSDMLLKQHFDGVTDRYECELRLRHVDGHWVWVLDRGRVITRTLSGQPDRMFGTRWDITAHKHEQLTLSRSEAFLDRTGRLAGVGGWELDLTTNALTWSDETRRMHGVAVGEQPDLDAALGFYAEEARPVITAAVAQAVENGEGWDLELPLVRRDGRRIWARAVGSVETHAGRAVRLVGAFQDITQRKELELELRIASARVQDLYDNAPCGYHSLDDQGRFLHVNATAARWLGCSRDDLVGKRRVQEFLTPQGQDLFRESFGLLMREGRVEGLEFDLLPLGRDPRRVSVSASVIHDAEGKYVMSRTVMFDITDLHRTREAVRQLTAQQAAMLENDMIGILRLRARRPVWANRALGRIFGYTPEELLGQPSRMLYLDDESHRLIGVATQGCLSQGETYRTQLQMRRKDGTPIWIDMGGMAMPDCPDEMLWSLNDITSLKQAEALRLQAQDLESQNRQLLASSQLKNQFLANMSHELRTPLNAVIGFSHLLRSGAVKPDSPKYASYLDRIGSSGTHLLQLIQSMLDYSKAASDRIEFQVARLDLRQVIEDVIGMLQERCDRSAIVMSCAVATEVCHVDADPLRLRQVLLNLATNAVKFSHAGGSVEIWAQRDGDGCLRIEVEDHGIGIALSDQPRLFQEFQQLSVGAMKTHDGTGIGLALVKRLVEAQGGAVGVKSTLGAGSLFYFTLPLMQSSQPAALAYAI